MSEQEINWFKNKAEREDLEEVIEKATTERSVEVEDFKTEENKYFTEQMQNVRWQLRDIDDLLEPTVDLVPQEQNLDRLTSELIGTLDELTARLTNYAKSNKDIAQELNTFITTSEKIQQIVHTLQKVVVNDELMAQYATQKYNLLEVIKEIEVILEKRDDIDESKLSPILN